MMPLTEWVPWSGRRPQGRAVDEGRGLCVLPDFSDPVWVSDCLERVARKP
jgi:hypothetical protein